MGSVVLNLKKQGILPLTFANAKDYDNIQEDDRIDLVGITNLAPNKPLQMIFNHKDGTKETIIVNHTLNQNQIDWFKAGSALNLIAKNNC